MSEPARTFPVAPSRSSAPPRVRPDLTSYNHLRLVVDRDALEDEADVETGLAALAEWEADGRRTVPFDEVRAQADARDAAEQ
jgi:hypothetical protein